MIVEILINYIKEIIDKYFNIKVLGFGFFGVVVDGKVLICDIIYLEGLDIVE